MRKGWLSGSRKSGAKNGGDSVSKSCESKLTLTFLESAASGRTFDSVLPEWLLGTEFCLVPEGHSVFEKVEEVEIGVAIFFLPTTDVFKSGMTHVSRSGPIFPLSALKWSDCC